MQNAIPQRNGYLRQAGPRDRWVPGLGEGDTTHEHAHEDPDVADHDDSQHDNVGDPNGTCGKDTQIKNQNGDLCAGEAHRVENEAVPLFLRSSLSAMMVGWRVSGAYHLPLLYVFRR